MLDRKYVIVTEHAKSGDEFFPPFLAMTVAAGAEDPTTIPLVRIFLGVEHTGERQIAIVDLRVFGVHVEDGVAQDTNRRNRIDTLPEHVAGIVVAPDRRSGDRPEFQHRFRAVHDKSGMHLDCDLDAMFFRKLGMLGPIRNYLLFPLPVEDIQVFRRPGAGDPVRVLSVIAVTRAAGEIYDGRHT
jgi:hypothetical protein